MNNWYKNISVLGKIGLICLILIVGFEPALAKKPRVDDQQITQAIENDLLLDQAVSAHLIDVTTDKGIVTLSGTVNQLLAKERAVRVAESIKGVLNVINQIEVNPIERADSDIKQDIKNALKWDAATESYEIDVSVNNGVVTLSGNVQSWAEKQLAAKVAKNVHGIKNIQNNIEVTYPEERPDTEIETEIRKRMEYNPYIDEQLINVSVNSGKVQLSGTAGSIAEKRHAYGVSWVNGVVAVNTGGLTVEAWAKDEMKKKTVNPRTDAMIQRVITEKFHYHPRLAPFEIKVNSDNGIVMLSGIVDHLKAKKVAQKVAQDTKGVVTVYNRIKVRPTDNVKDDTLTQRIQDAVGRDVYLDRFQMTIRVRNQKAYLYGDVDSFYEKERAEDIISQITGVADVQNNLTVLNTWTPKEDQRVESDIEKHFFWSLFVDSDQISVEVTDGVAVLNGTANSWHEVKAAVANAFEGGARTVKSQLQVTGSEEYFPVTHEQTYYHWPVNDWMLEYSKTINP